MNFGLEMSKTDQDPRVNEVNKTAGSNLCCFGVNNIEETLGDQCQMPIKLILIYFHTKFENGQKKLVMDMKIMLFLLKINKKFYFGRYWWVIN